MKNRYKLNSMTDKELAGFFCEAMEKIAYKADIDLCDICPVSNICKKGHNGFLAWLEKEAEDT